MSTFLSKEHKHLVCVVWDDAHAMLAGDYTAQEVQMQFHKPSRYHAFGLLVQEDEAGITIATEWCEEGWRGLNFIPKGMIVETIDLGEPKRKKTKKKPQPQTEEGAFFVREGRNAGKSKSLAH